ncbi:unnamed protein product, partial [Phaeothamnion confervicola]
LHSLTHRIEARHLVQVKEYEAAPTDAAAYGKASFWDARYLQSEEVFEWYHPWPNLAPSLSRYLATTDRVLLCGCGNSDMGAEMCADGYEHVTGADISRVVIDQMSDKHPDLTCEFFRRWWRHVSTDLTLTGFADGEFDVAIDKACLDAVSCHMEGPERLRKYLQEMDRITADEGAFVCISHAPPAQRLPLLEDFDADRPATMLAWDVHVDAIAKPTPQRFALPDLTDASEMYFIYVCLKNPDKAARKRWLLEKGERDRQKALAKALGRPRPPGGRGRGR